MAPAFRYDGAVLAGFPTIRGGVILAGDVVNGPTPAALAAGYAAEQQAVRDRLAGTPLSEVPSLVAWRTAFRGFGVDPTKYRSAAESLLRRLTKKGDVPSINALVDLANLASIRHALPVAVFDRAAVAGGLTVRFAAGDEPFADLGSSDTGSPDAGEVVFVDDGGVVAARRWCWRQSRQSAAGPATTQVLITVEGHHPSADADVAAATDDLVALLGEHVPDAAAQAVVLGPDRPASPW